MFFCTRFLSFFPDTTKETNKQTNKTSIYSRRDENLRVVGAMLIGENADAPWKETIMNVATSNDDSNVNNFAMVGFFLSFLCVCVCVCVFLVVVGGTKTQVKEI